ncbi:MmcQ/YjbR family DNA-binding protein [Virgisporangium aurantiacum]|uniref:MmcQ/YjbR family DNA-binding protein n=1 Tax=Virgisporangium aurantiacum TaxID=175570 RepID=A0A8J4E8F0_9ACTN|nr:MmcQ/YjbR family DNA-binding protein [Virgisporangium aurantiacum]GIJ62727.1 hypothetical protein Vau01_102430 [Virgisporangium aurantiacum]
MATWDDVRRLALALPETAEAEMAWKVKDKGFAWERPLRKKDLADLGAAAPDGPILCVRTPGVGAKETLLADSPHVYFTTPHFNGYPAVLVRLGEIDADELAEILEEAWLAVAPKRLAKEYLTDRG